MSKRELRPPAALKPRKDNDNERLVSLESTGFSYESLKKLSCFDELGDTNWESLRSFPGAIIIRFYKKGEIICHQDDPGYTAFYILKHREIASLTESRQLPPIKSFSKWNPRAVASVRRQYYGKAAKESKPAYMSEGDIFGEMSCLYRVPRTATVTAEHDCYVMECMRNVFSKAKFKDKLGTKVIERILELHLRGFELFEKLSDEAYLEIVEKIKVRVGLTGPFAEDTLLPTTRVVEPAPSVAASKKTKKAMPSAHPDFATSREHNEMLFAENDRPDGLYIIRLGLVKIIKNGSPLLSKACIPNWLEFQAALAAGAIQTAGRHHDLWLALEKSKCKTEQENQDKASILKRLQADSSVQLSPAEQQELLYALNDLLKLKNFHQLIQFKFDPADAQHKLLEADAKSLKDSKDFDDTLHLRTFNRRILELIFGEAIHIFGITPPRTLAYRSSREWVFPEDDGPAFADSSLIGEIGMFKNLPRSATCVVYCHPESRFGKAELIYIDKELFQDLLKETRPEPQKILDSRADYVGRVMKDREKQTETRLQLSVWQESANAQEFDELGLIQGRKLMLIDLDRCTRCDKCVEACVESHAPRGSLEAWVEDKLAGWIDWLPFRNVGPRDGRSRLFLDGPRVEMVENDRIKTYLVASTCRQCKDAVCLFECPVCSIHKGDNGQIVIEDWCVGCTQCAKICPYNAIQMHTVGVIPTSTFGWKCADIDDGRGVQRTPFYYNQAIAKIAETKPELEFTYPFTLSSQELRTSQTFKLEVKSILAGDSIKVRLNNQEVSLKEKAALLVLENRQDEEADEKELTFLADEPPQKKLRQGPNLLTIVLTLPGTESLPKMGSMLLDAGMVGFVEPKVDREVLEKNMPVEVLQANVVCGRARHEELQHGGQLDFRYSFNLSGEQLAGRRVFLELKSNVAGIGFAAIVNDANVVLEKKKIWKALLVHKDEKSAKSIRDEPAPQATLKLGDNTLAIHLQLSKEHSMPNLGDWLMELSLAIDVEEYNQEWVTETAVVCDMCSGQWGQQPACVNACPHEAAERRFITFGSFVPAGKK